MDLWRFQPPVYINGVLSICYLVYAIIMKPEFADKKVIISSISKLEINICNNFVLQEMCCISIIT